MVHGNRPLGSWTHNDPATCLEISYFIRSTFACLSLTRLLTRTTKPVEKMEQTNQAVGLAIPERARAPGDARLVPAGLALAPAPAPAPGNAGMRHPARWEGEEEERSVGVCWAWGRAASRPAGRDWNWSSTGTPCRENAAWLDRGPWLCRGQWLRATS